MALEKITLIDKVEILMETGHIQLRQITRISEDGDIISQSTHRRVILKGGDTSNEDQLVQSIAALVWQN